VAYAVKYASKFDIFVILNRYVYSKMAYHHDANTQ